MRAGSTPSPRCSRTDGSCPQGRCYRSAQPRNLPTNRTCEHSNCSLSARILGRRGTGGQGDPQVVRFGRSPASVVRASQGLTHMSFGLVEGALGLSGATIEEQHHDGRPHATLGFAKLPARNVLRAGTRLAYDPLDARRSGEDLGPCDCLDGQIRLAGDAGTRVAGDGDRPAPAAADVTQRAHDVGPHPLAANPMTMSRSLTLCALGSLAPSASESSAPS